MGAYNDQDIRVPMLSNFRNNVSCGGRWFRLPQWLSKEDCWLFSVFFVLGFLMFFSIYYWSPEFVIPARFQINGAFSEKNLNGTSMIKWDIDVYATNPNKISTASYHRFQVSIYRDDVFVAGTVIRPFTQSAHNTTLLHTSVSKPRSEVPPPPYDVRLKTIFQTHGDVQHMWNLVSYCDFLDVDDSPKGSIKGCTTYRNN